MGKRDRPLKPSSRGKETKESNVTVSGYMTISLRYFHDSDNDPAQSLKTWEEEGMLLSMLSTFQHVTSNDIKQLQSKDKKLCLYGGFPDSTVNEFSLPSSLDKNLNWGVLRNIGGQKPRIVGFLQDNVFYIVYLDKDHKFYKSSKG